MSPNINSPLRVPTFLSSIKTKSTLSPHHSLVLAISKISLLPSVWLSCLMSLLKPSNKLSNIFNLHLIVFSLKKLTNQFSLTMPILATNKVSITSSKILRNFQAKRPLLLQVLSNSAFNQTRFINN